MKTYKLLKEDSVLLAQPYLIDMLGRTGAQFLSQIHYWIENQKKEIIHLQKKWVCSTAENWAEQLRVSPRTINRYLKKFQENNLIFIEKLSPFKSNRTNYITINYMALESLEKNMDKMSQSLGQNVAISLDKINKKDLKNIQKENVKCFEEPIAEKMLDQWNKSFEASQQNLTSELSKKLSSVLKNDCGDNFNKWVNYLTRLKSSAYINSKDFSLNIFWALKPITIKRIFNGDLGANNIPIPLDENQEKQDAMDHIFGVNEEEKLKRLRRLIVEKLGSSSYNAWFTKVDFKLCDGVISFKAHSQFIEDYIKQHFYFILNLQV